MYLGYIIGDNTIPFLKEINSLNQRYYKNLPLLIVGYDKACSFFKETTLQNFQINDNTYFCFSLEEEPETKINVKKILELFYEKKTKDLEFVTVLNLSDIVLEKDKKVFLNETNKGYYFTQNNKCYYLSKVYAQYYNIEYNLDLLKDYLIFSVNGELFNDVRPLIKSFFNEYEDEKVYRGYLLTFKDVEKNFGCLLEHWFEDFNIDSQFEINEYKVWERAFKVEKLLSNSKVRINDTLTDEFYEPIIDNSYQGYIKQRYKGTNKQTGRMFTFKDAFCLQTLATNFKNIIIAKENCLLIEFDYNYFEFEILRQICNLEFKGDPHSYVSEKIFGNKEHRQQAKGINYSILYGKSLKKIEEDLKDFEDIPNKIKQIEDIFIKPIEPLKQMLEKDFKLKKYFVGHFGRKIYPDSIYKCINYFTQNAAADFLIIKLEKIFELLKKYNNDNSICLQNHDSILLNISQDDITDTDIIKQLKSILLAPENGVKASISMEFGENWRDIKNKKFFSIKD